MRGVLVSAAARSGADAPIPCGFADVCACMCADSVCGAGTHAVRSVKCRSGAGVHHATMLQRQQGRWDGMRWRQGGGEAGAARLGAGKAKGGAFRPGRGVRVGARSAMVFQLASGYL